MTKRAKILFFTGIALFVLVGVERWLAGPDVNVGNYERIKLLMTKREVESLLGPGTECKKNVEAQLGRGGITRQYDGEGYSIVVKYDQSSP